MRLNLSLMGPVRMTAEDGRDMTPRGRKARAVLALLGTAPDLRMARARLQDRLWSVSPPAQGAASLRQTLRELRLALNGARAALLSGEGWVGLDGALVSISLRPVTGPTGEPCEFAEDLDIDDPEFEDWLRNTRLALEDQPPAPEMPLLVLTEPKADCPHARMLASCVLMEAADRAGQLIPARVVQAGTAGGGSQPGLGAGLGAGFGAGFGAGMRIEAHCLPQEGGRLLMMMVLRDLRDGAQLWAQYYPVSAAMPDLRRAGASIALTIMQTAGQMAGPARSLYPLRDLFSFSRPRLLSADQRLKAAEGAVPQALRAFLRYTLIIERQSRDPRALLDEAEELAHHARDAAPGDPIVLSVASLMQSWRGHVAGALDLARLACRVAPGHDMAHLALSQALSDAGRNSDALMAGLRAGTGPLAVLGQASWRMRLAVSQIRLNRLAEAEASAEIALAHAPDCRPALRVLAALRYHRRDEAGAATALATLREAEPDFSLPLMASPDYPVTTLRRTELLGVTQSGL